MANNTAFEILYKEYYVRVFGLCRRLLSSNELAEDAAQETFMRAYRKFRSYKSNQPFWQWIAAIANNHCIDLLRKRSRTEALFGDEADELEAYPDDDSSVVSELITAEQTGSLNDAIAELDPKYRVPIVLAYFSQLSYDEIARQLEISRNHVGVLLLRGKQRLRSQLGSDAQEGSQ